jgi:RNA polymerase sigma-70 factor (ECF subfamily)
VASDTLDLIAQNSCSGAPIHTTPPTLLERLRTTADEAAWRRFVHLYTPLLFAWARRCGETEHDAADLVQEMFTTLVQTLPTFRYDRTERFRSWLRTLMLNKLRDRKRRQTRSDKAMDELRYRAELSEAEAFWESDYRSALARRALHLMQADFAPATWKACWETVVQGRAPASVARELGISENAVYIAKHRVLQRLRQELADLLD